MADWYVSSAAWTAIPQFAASGVYTVGNIVRPLTAPAFSAQFAFRCTVAGTASTEPTWTSANNNGQTVISGGATFANVSGQSAYGWAAAAGNASCISNGSAGANRIAIGDRIFLSSDHSESSTTATYQFPSVQGFGTVAIISVNRAGSVPPVAADALSGAAIIYTGSSFWTLEPFSNTYWQGVTITLGGNGSQVFLASSASKSHYFRNCAFVFSTTNTTANICVGNQAQVTFDNTTVQFNNAGQRLLTAGNGAPWDFRWINTAAATLGTVPTILFSGSSTTEPSTIVCRGVGLNAVTTTLYYGGSTAFGKVLFDSCRIASGAVRLGTAAYNNTDDEVELVNCYDGTSFLSERHTPAGDVTTEFTITLSAGATDNVGTFSHKLVSSTRADKYAMTLDSFWMDTNYATTGSAKTATVEIISSGTLNTDDIALVVEYEGTAASSLASFVSSFPAVVPTTPIAITTSTATWNSLPATPQKQQLSVSFTPQTAGRVRAQVRLGKASTTVYVNPQVTIS